MQSKYTKESIEEAVKKSNSIAGVCRILGCSTEGNSWYQIKKKLNHHQIDISHFLGHAAHAGPLQTGKCKKLLPEEILVSNKLDREKTPKLRRSLLAIGKPYCCELCLLPGVWRDKVLMLEIDHIDGDWSNCKQENLRFLCPNCHTQETYPDFKL